MHVITRDDDECYARAWTRYQRSRDGPFSFSTVRDDIRP
jgi:hypothetical protein